jgi:hypothetical protein
VHFLKIDVEGAESSVIRSIDLMRFRPWILVVESVQPLSSIGVHEHFDAMLTAADYSFVYFDGLNRFYLAKERIAELGCHFLVPPNVFDGFIRRSEYEASKELLSLRVSSQIRQFRQLEMPPPAGSGKLDWTQSQATFLDLDIPAPTLTAAGSQLCTAGQFREPLYAEWCQAIKQLPRLHRKQWEFVYVLQVLQASGILRDGARGVGFGCGQEPIPAVLALRGCTIVATDLGADDAAGHGWMETGQHAQRLEDLNLAGICPPDLFADRVSFRPVDMNRIPADLQDFDFTWSSCSFEHLGSIDHGLEFVVNSTKCLSPGGIAVHTTECNLTSNSTTLESRDLSLFRRQDFERLSGMLREAGATLSPINFNPGDTELDQYFDLPPYRQDPHLKLQLANFVSTSIGLVITKN